MSKTKVLKQGLLLISPLLLFVLLVVPYNWANRTYIVDWLGCGCPQIDSWGNIVHPAFNANDFTGLFWLVVTVCVTGISVVLSRHLSKRWLRVVYVTGMLTVSLLISYGFYRSMMWT